MADYKKDDGWSIDDANAKGGDDEDDEGPMNDGLDDDCRNLVRKPRLASLLYILMKEKQFPSLDTSNLKFSKADKFSYLENALEW